MSENSQHPQLSSDHGIVEISQQLSIANQPVEPHPSDVSETCQTEAQRASPAYINLTTKTLDRASSDGEQKELTTVGNSSAWWVTFEFGLGFFIKHVLAAFSHLR